MGIKPYGLFGVGESNTTFGPGYEIKRQLAARQAQLDALSGKEVLSPDEQKRKEQLTNTVNQLNDTLNRRTAPKPDRIINDSNTVPKNTSPKPPNSAPTAPNSMTFAEGSVIPKSLYRSPATATQNSDYLKGFFLDLKI